MDSPGEPWGSTRTPSERPASRKSSRSSRSQRSQASRRTTEQTPLLAREDQSDHEEDAEENTPATTSLLRSLSDSLSSGKTPVWKKRWPSLVALILLCIVVVLIMLGFLATEGIEEYAMQAADFKPTKVALDSLTDHGAKVLVEGEFSMDASKVERQSVRNLGRFGTWIAREVETGPTTVDVYLPEYGNLLIGAAKIPGITVNIRNGHTTHVSFLAGLEPGYPDAIRNIANDWIEGRLGQIRLKGNANVPLKSGIIHLGSQFVEKSLVLEGSDLPELPKFNITKLNLREANDGGEGMGADATIMVTNGFPVQLTVPPVAVDVLVDGCLGEQNIMVGTAQSSELQVKPETDLEVKVTGKVDKLSDSLTEVCPDSSKSPLDSFLSDYMKGDDATVYINCCRFPDPSTPDWARELLKDITVPVPLAGREMGNLIKNFSLTNVHFSLPEPFAEPGTPEAAPKISATVNVDIGIPNEMNFPLDVNRVKAIADIYYHGDLLGKLNLEKWQHANSTRVEGHGEEGPSLLVESDIQKAPIEILDDDLFSEVVQALLFGSKRVVMDIKAAVSVGVDTPMGKFAIRGIPAEGVVPVKPIRRGHDDNADKGLSSLSPKFGDLSIVDTSPTSITLQAHLNITNPTNYSATVPYFSVNVLVNDTILAQATARDAYIHPGNNTNIVLTAVWDPSTNSGAKGKKIGAEMLSQYVSGFNTSLTIQAHNGTIPAQPGLGFLLSQFPVTIPAPHVSQPKKPSDGDDDDDDPDGDDDDEKRPHFIQAATMHIFTSTAIFTLASPFSSTVLYITKLNATSYYEDHPSGTILYEQPFAVPPGLSETPRLPVDWSLGSVGYEAIKNALGGTLKLSAFAHVGIRIGHWNEEIWFKGGKIGAKVRL